MKIKIIYCSECSDCTKKSNHRYCAFHNIQLNDFPNRPEWCNKKEFILNE